MKFKRFVARVFTDMSPGRNHGSIKVTIRKNNNNINIQQRRYLLYKHDDVACGPLCVVTIDCRSGKKKKTCGERETTATAEKRRRLIGGEQSNTVAKNERDRWKKELNCRTENTHVVRVVCVADNNNNNNMARAGRPAGLRAAAATAARASSNRIAAAAAEKGRRRRRRRCHPAPPRPTISNENTPWRVRTVHRDTRARRQRPGGDEGIPVCVFVRAYKEGRRTKLT